MNIMGLSKWLVSALLLALAGLCVPAYAIPNTVTGNGVTWTLSSTAIPGVDTTGSFTLEVDATGWDLGGPAYLTEFSLKNFGSSAMISNLTLLPSAGHWDWENNGLNAQGCKDNGAYDALCIFNTDSYSTGTGPTTGPATGTTFTFSFDIALDDVFPDFTHLKVRWVDADGDKVGSLISKDISWIDVDVPEPGILALLALGLIGIRILTTASGRKHGHRLMARIRHRE